jgi:serine/threonine protein kinase
LITKLLARDPAQRISAADAMRHPVFHILQEDKPHFLVERVVDNLMNRTESKFLQIIIYFYALRWIHSYDLEEERATFYALDVDNDGRLSQADIFTALKDRYTPAQIREALVVRHH